MKKIILFTSLFLFTAIYSNAQSYEEKLVDVMKSLGTNSYDKGLKLLDEIIEEYPEMPLTYVIKGDILSKFVDTYTVDSVTYKKAEEQYNIALSLNETFIPAHQSKGVLNIYHQKFELAVIDFTNVIKYAGDDEDLLLGYTNRASSNTFLENFEQVLEDYDKAIQLKPEMASIYGNMGMVYRKMDNLVMAKKFTNTAIELADDKEIYIFINNLGLINMDQKNYDEAVTMFNKIIDKEPNSPVALNNRGFARIKLKQYDLAKLDISKSISIYPENSYAFKNKAILHFELNQKEYGCQNLEEAERLGYSKMYGTEVQELMTTHCKK